MSKNNRFKVVEHHHYQNSNFGFNKATAVKGAEAILLGALGYLGNWGMEKLREKLNKKEEQPQGPVPVVIVGGEQ